MVLLIVCIDEEHDINAYISLVTQALLFKTWSTVAVPSKPPKHIQASAAAYILAPSQKSRHSLTYKKGRAPDKTPHSPSRQRVKININSGSPALFTPASPCRGVMAQKGPPECVLLSNCGCQGQLGRD
ncbi:hypothetical protein GWK47_047963 [Chionoecetes opilio]|uniref:Uncharacterized protein n=1 Tax=Chionoecetes opilio TaxID=41210 RepID=A0A8J4Y491_CHIOP|nr:hypothetical protein GWK47_047963 [Chionoecetes opilio]